MRAQSEDIRPRTCPRTPALRRLLEMVVQVHDVTGHVVRQRVEARVDRRNCVQGILVQRRNTAEVQG